VNWNQTTSWLFDIGAAITCINSPSFNTAFGQQKPRKISNAQSCIAASGDAMNSVGVYKVDLWMKGRKFMHPIRVITELNDNNIAIDFMHKHKLIYDVHTRQVKFADSHLNTISTTKQVTIPAMTSYIVNAKFNVEKQKDKTYIANIHFPATPITGIPAIVTMDDNNNCKVMVENCPPYDVTIKRNDLMGLIEIEEEELIPLTDRTISAICMSIQDKLPNIQKPRISREEIDCHWNLQVLDEFWERYPPTHPPTPIDIPDKLARSCISQHQIKLILLCPN
jgi:hypothetical protein